LVSGIEQASNTASSTHPISRPVSRPIPARDRVRS
jgi:hypothetical protein